MKHRYLCVIPQFVVIVHPFEAERRQWAHNMLGSGVGGSCLRGKPFISGSFFHFWKLCNAACVCGSCFGVVLTESIIGSCSYERQSITDGVMGGVGSGRCSERQSIEDVVLGELC